MLSLPIVGTVSTTIWLVVCLLVRLERLAVRRSRAAGDRISASSTTRPGEVTERRPRAQALRSASDESDASAHGRTRAPLMRSPAPRSAASANAFAGRRARTPLPASSSLDARRARRARAAPARRRAAAPSCARSPRPIPRTVTRVAKPMSARITTRRSSMARRARGSPCASRRGEELPLEELRLRVLRHFERGARRRAGTAARSRDVRRSRARTARRRRGSRRTDVSDRARSSPSRAARRRRRPRRARRATRRARRPSTRSRDRRRTCRRRS